MKPIVKRLATAYADGMAQFEHHLEQYGFKLEEDINKHLGYRITHWMPIPDIPNK